MPLQIAAGVRVLVRSGVGFTVTVIFCGDPAQVVAVVVYTYVTTIGVVVVFVSISLTSPLPLPAALLMPATVALVQAKVAPVVALVAV